MSFYAVCYMGTMLRLVQIKTWFIGIIFVYDHTQESAKTFILQTL